MKITKKLPKRFKERFLKALRSGKYFQGNGSLRTVETDYDWDSKKTIKIVRHCCLGVACDIQEIKKVWGATMIPNKDKYMAVPALLRGNGEISNKLALMNDSGKSFKQIATWIEKNL